VVDMRRRCQVTWGFAAQWHTQRLDGLGGAHRVQHEGAALQPAHHPRLRIHAVQAANPPPCTWCVCCRVSERSHTHHTTPWPELPYSLPKRKPPLPKSRERLTVVERVETRQAILVLARWICFLAANRRPVSG